MLNVPSFKEGVILVLWIIGVILFCVFLLGLMHNWDRELPTAGLLSWLIGVIIARFAKP